MLIVIAKEKDNINRIIKKYKNKVDKINLVKKVRNRIAYKKPSTKRREEIQKAIYTERFIREHN